MGTGAVIPNRGVKVMVDFRAEKVKFDNVLGWNKMVVMMPKAYATSTQTGNIVRKPLS